MKQQHSDLIEALRGVAVLGVMMVHSGQVFPDLPWPVKRLAEHGERGVQLFFILSAVTLMMSWHARQEPCPSWRFIVRRFFRIAPMFYLALAVCGWFNGLAGNEFAPYGLKGYEYLVSALFINGWFPNALNSVVPGGWSIAAEFSFYLVFPLLVRAVRGIPSAIVGFLLAIGVDAAAHRLIATLAIPADPLLARQMTDFLFWWPLHQLPVFFIGFALYFLLHGAGRRPLDAWVPPRLARPVGLALAGLSLVSMLALLVIWVPAAYLCYSLLFALLIVGLTLAPSSLVVNRAVRHIGAVSYSAYFIHFAVVLSTRGIAARLLPPDVGGFLVYFGFVILATTLLSTITHHLVERPGIALGRHVARAIRPRAAAPGAVAAGQPQTDATGP